MENNVVRDYKKIFEEKYDFLKDKGLFSSKELFFAASRWTGDKLLETYTEEDLINASEEIKNEDNWLSALLCSIVEIRHVWWTDNEGNSSSMKYNTFEEDYKGILF